MLHITRYLVRTTWKCSVVIRLFNLFEYVKLNYIARTIYIDFGFEWAKPYFFHTVSMEPFICYNIVGLIGTIKADLAV